MATGELAPSGDENAPTHPGLRQLYDYAQALLRGVRRELGGVDGQPEFSSSGRAHVCLYQNSDGYRVGLSLTPLDEQGQLTVGWSGGRPRLITVVTESEGSFTVLVAGTYATFARSDDPSAHHGQVIHPKDTRVSVYAGVFVMPDELKYVDGDLIPYWVPGYGAAVQVALDDESAARPTIEAATLNAAIAQIRDDEAAELEAGMGDQLEQFAAASRIQGPSGVGRPQD